MRLSSLCRAITAGAAFVGLASAVTSPAGAVVLTDTQVQTTDGQDFTFVFAGAPSPAGDGFLEFLIRGDFSGYYPGNESFNFDLEGVLTGTDITLTSGTLVTSYGFDDNLFRTSFAVTSAQLAAITADGVVNLSVDYATGVSAIFSASPYITATLNYPSATAVPEPGTWAMMLLGFAAAGYSLRRRGRGVARLAQMA